MLYIDDTFDFAKDVPFRHEVWMLEIKYKPIRMIWADIPGPDARMQRKQIWYMVYQVTNPGKVFRSVEPDDKLYKLVTVDKPVRFVPVFTLEVHNALRKEVEGSAKVTSSSTFPSFCPPSVPAKTRTASSLPRSKCRKRSFASARRCGVLPPGRTSTRTTSGSRSMSKDLTNAYTFADDPAKYAASKRRQAAVS